MNQIRVDFVTGSGDFWWLMKTNRNRERRNWRLEIDTEDEEQKEMEMEMEGERTYKWGPESRGDKSMGRTDDRQMRHLTRLPEEPPDKRIG